MVAGAVGDGRVSAERSSGGHRRYSRRMLARAVRARELFDEGHNLAATQRIVDLEDQLGAARDEITGLRRQLDDHARAGK